jgi:lipopolysaccharide/colanic/teichoic acid biosynthesis glycosyltransferase
VNYTDAVQGMQPSAQSVAAAARRFFDLLAAGGALVIFVPIMLLVAAAIYFDDGWPIFFSQRRLGLWGRQFDILKFRKFHRTVNSGGSAVTHLTICKDPRLTALGALLEKTKLDELPQLWNILRGDMAIVGPRPETPDLAQSTTCLYAAVLRFRPGLFGPNQYYFRNETALFPPTGDPENYYREAIFPLKTLIDLEYFSQRTIWSDLGWIARGVLAVGGLRLPFARPAWIDDKLQVLASDASAASPVGSVFPTNCKVKVAR